MRRRLLPGMLVLALLTTWVDDLVAAGTPEASDDIQAIENNHFLTAVKLYRHETPTWGLASQIALPAPRPFGLSLADLLHNSQVVPHFTADGTDLLYRLSFLRR